MRNDLACARKMGLFGHLAHLVSLLSNTEACWSLFCEHRPRIHSTKHQTNPANTPVVGGWSTDCIVSQHQVHQAPIRNHISAWGGCMGRLAKTNKVWSIDCIVSQHQFHQAPIQSCNHISARGGVARVACRKQTRSGQSIALCPRINSTRHRSNPATHHRVWGVVRGSPAGNLPGLVNQLHCVPANKTQFETFLVV